MELFGFKSTILFYSSIYIEQNRDYCSSIYRINNLLHMIVCLPIKNKIDIYSFNQALLNSGDIKGSDRGLSNLLKLIHQYHFQHKKEKKRLYPCRSISNKPCSFAITYTQKQ